MFVSLADDACFFVPPSSAAQNRLVDDLIEGSARFSVYMFADERMAYARVMRPVFDGPVVTERWDPNSYEWIPA